MQILINISSSPSSRQNLAGVAAGTPFSKRESPLVCVLVTEQDTECQKWDRQEERQSPESTPAYLGSQALWAKADAQDKDVCSRCSRLCCKTQVPASSQTTNFTPWRLLRSLTSEDPSLHGYQSKISFPQKEKWPLELSWPLCMRLESDINTWYHTEHSQLPRRSRGHVFYQYRLARVTCFYLIWFQL